MIIGGGLGPLPVEAIILDEFVPEEDLIRRIEAMLRVFNKYGNRANKNKARFKFIVRERGADWVRDAIAREYADIVANGGITTPEAVPDGFGGFQVEPQPLGTGRELPVLNGQPSDPGYVGWSETNVAKQHQAGYSVVTITVPQGNLTGEQMRGIAHVARTGATACCVSASGRTSRSGSSRTRICRACMQRSTRSAWPTRGPMRSAM